MVALIHFLDLCPTHIVLCRHPYVLQISDINVEDEFMLIIVFLLKLTVYTQAYSPIESPLRASDSWRCSTIFLGEIAVIQEEEEDITMLSCYGLFCI